MHEVMTLVKKKWKSTFEVKLPLFPFLRPVCRKRRSGPQEHKKRNVFLLSVALSVLFRLVGKWCLLRRQRSIGFLLFHGHFHPSLADHDSVNDNPSHRRKKKGEMSDYILYLLTHLTSFFSWSQKPHFVQVCEPKRILKYLRKVRTSKST